MTSLAHVTVAVSGALALTMGVAGLLAPRRQVGLMGFDNTDGSPSERAATLW